MIPTAITHLIIKYLNETISDVETDTLNDWLKSKENHTLFNSYVKTQFLITIGTTTVDTDKINHKLLSEINSKTTNTFNWKSLYKYAALLIIVISIAFYTKQYLTTANLTVISPNAITLQTDDAHPKNITKNVYKTLTNSNGDIIGRQENSRLIYKKNKNISVLAYHTLRVPYGEKFDLVLSDDTHIILNSGSSIKYPTQFSSGNKREVYLEGEAFFKVAKDSIHPFIVNTQALNVKVLGTDFNVSNYKEDKELYVVLVEGSVNLEINNQTNKLKHKTNLIPGTKGSFDKKEKIIRVQKINTDSYTSWIKGNLVFRNTTFQNFITKLERQYNVKIINTNKELSKILFSTTVETNTETLTDVLNHFSKIHPIHYSIKGNLITIN